MGNKTVPLLDLTAQYRSIQPEIDAAVQRVLESGQFILGEEVSAFEGEISAYLGVQHGIGVASGTDALILALRALEIGPGDEVLVPAYTFFATAGAVLHVGARPVLVDIDPQTYCMDPERIGEKISPASKAIIPVHLYGHPAEMAAIARTARENNLRVIEDNAQALGAATQGRKTGGWGDLACLSFFPTKNLGGYGDGGMVVTDDPDLAEKIRMLRAHGWKQKYFPETLGYNSRLDALQAAILRAKLPQLDGWNDRRRALARRYNQALAANPAIGTPYEAPGCRHVYHLYVVRLGERERVRQALSEAGVATAIYYPQPVHLTQPCRALGYRAGDFPAAEAASRETLAIPLYPEMGEAAVEAVLRALLAGAE